jgi:type II restriction/modification system DNA methylase subunit YeeA
VVPAKTHAEEGVCNLKGGNSGALASRFQPQASNMSFMAMQYATKLGTEQLKGWEGVDKLKRWEWFDNASLELLNINESLKRWKSEVDVGLERLKAVIKQLESGGLGLGSLG